MTRYELKRSEYVTKLPKGKHSTKGNTTKPDLWNGDIVQIVTGVEVTTGSCIPEVGEILHGQYYAVRNIDKIRNQSIS